MSLDGVKGYFRYSTSDKEEADKVLMRLCKEINIFPGILYDKISDFVAKNDSYVFYGHSDVLFSDFGDEIETNCYKLQLDLAKKLIEENLLSFRDYGQILTDTLMRYKISSNGIKHYWADKYEFVSIHSRKKDFVKFFMQQYEEKIGPISYKIKMDIFNGLPT